ncbi:hypothetical protein ACG7TL_001111 [Trametes sanguinea]
MSAQPDPPPSDAAQPDAPGPSHTQASPPARRRYIPQRRSFTRVFAVKIPNECIRQWLRCYWDKTWPGAREQYPSDEAFYQFACRVEHLVIDSMVRPIYHHVRNLPPLKRNLITISDPAETKRDEYLFVFTDNSSPEACSLKLRKGDVRAAMRYLGVQDQEPQVYDLRVSAYLTIGLRIYSNAHAVHRD